MGGRVQMTHLLKGVCCVGTPASVPAWPPGCSLWDTKMSSLRGGALETFPRSVAEQGSCQVRFTPCLVQAESRDCSLQAALLL